VLPWSEATRTEQQQQQQQQAYLGSKTCPSHTTLHAASCLNDDSISKSFFSSAYSSSTKHSTAQPLLPKAYLCQHITPQSCTHSYRSSAGKPPRQLVSSLFRCMVEVLHPPSLPPSPRTCSVLRASMTGLSCATVSASPADSAARSSAALASLQAHTYMCTAQCRPAATDRSGQE
jgi:hypothetical protein